MEFLKVVVFLEHTYREHSKPSLYQEHFFKTNSEYLNFLKSVNMVVDRKETFKLTLIIFPLTVTNSVMTSFVELMSLGDKGKELSKIFEN